MQRQHVHYALRAAPAAVQRPGTPTSTTPTGQPATRTSVRHTLVSLTHSLTLLNLIVYGCLSTRVAVDSDAGEMSRRKITFQNVRHLNLYTFRSARVRILLNLTVSINNYITT